MSSAVGNERRALAEEVPVGYKRTEVGMIPEEWEERKLGEIADVRNGATPSTQITAYWDGQIPWCIPTDITGTQGKYLATTERHITAKGLASCSASLLPVGALLLCSRATIGEVKIAQVKVCTNQGFKSLVCRQGISNEFLYYALLTLKPKMIELAIGSTFLEIGKHDIKSIFVALPQRTEQRAIAEALSDVDGLLAALEALIAKKRAIKQATMQQLLTGKTRLPGFSGAWSELNMARDSVLKARIGWQGLTTAEYLFSGQYYLVTGTDFVRGRVAWARCCFVDHSRFTQDRNIQLKLGDVLLTKDGTIGKAGFVDSLPGPNSGVFVIRPKADAYVSLYMYYVLTSDIFGNFLARLQAGSTIAHLYQKDFVDFAFAAPKTNEQRAIATVLSDMDAEIFALERRRDKTRIIKQGMMQQLLTGRVRLVQPEALTKTTTVETKDE